MNESQIARFLQENIEPWEDPHFGKYYRAAAYLIDETYLPCVMFGNPDQLIDLAIRRFSETENNKIQYRTIVGSFVARRASVPIYNVARVELSPFAWPLAIVEQIHGETIMGWTAFTAKMKDGRIFNFGSSFTFQFFDLPDGYSSQDIVEIHSGMVVAEDGTEKEFSWLDERVTCHREKPFFYCHTEYLPRPAGL